MSLIQRLAIGILLLVPLMAGLWAVPRLLDFPGTSSGAAEPAPTAEIAGAQAEPTPPPPPQRPVRGAVASPSAEVSPTAPQTSTPAPSPTPSPSPPPTATVDTPEPTPETPPTRETAALRPTAAADAVTAFYQLINQRDFARAAEMWSPRMRAAYPPAENIDRRFALTNRISVERADVVTVDEASGTATVAVELTEVAGRPPTSRHYSGRWHLIRGGGPTGWLLDAPQF